MAEYLFSYGTLQQPSVQLQLFGRTVEAKLDFLFGYRIKQIEIDDPAFLSRGEASVQKTLVSTGNSEDYVQGTVLQLSEEELLSVDKYEPVSYYRKKQMLQSGVEAWIYVADIESGL